MPAIMEDVQPVAAEMPSRHLFQEEAAQPKAEATDTSGPEAEVCSVGQNPGIMTILDFSEAADFGKSDYVSLPLSSPT
jgi:hypothetical protein